MSPGKLPQPATSPVILFDGVCNLCNGAVNFIIDHDPQARFRFASLQSQAGQALLRAHGLDHSLETGRMDSLVCIAGGRAHLKSGALVAIARGLGGWWRLPALAGAVLPRLLGDWCYDRVAANRYRWFGKRDVCRIPDAGLLGRFLDGG